jgi:shikimate dehydrogenase
MNDLLKNPRTYPVLCGILGNRPSRLSHAMHSAGYAAVGLPWVYVAFDTVDTAAGLSAMRSLSIRGLSLTIPHKETAVSLLDRVSDEVRAIGAVNTVVNDGATLSGHNTDWIGIRDALAEAGFEAAGRSVLLLGAGGAARAAAYAMKRLGAGRFIVANRSAERGKALADEFGGEFAPFSALTPDLVKGFDLVLNSTPIGSKLAPHEKPPLDVSSFRSGQCVFDFVTVPTELLASARSVGATTIAGSRMLLFQAFGQFKLFTGQDAPREEMAKALELELSKQ